MAGTKVNQSIVLNKSVNSGNAIGKDNTAMKGSIAIR